MAEEVKIVDVAGGPAAEATLQELLKVVKAMAEKSGKDTIGTENKTQQIYNKAVREGTTAKKGFTKEVEQSTGALKGMTKTVGTLIKGVFGTFTSILGFGVGVATNLFKAFGDGTSTLTDMVSQIPLFGSLLASVTGIFDDTLKTFQSLATSGASFNNNLTELRVAAAGAKVSLDSFASLVGSNTEKFAAFGGTVTEGAKNFVQVRKAMGAYEQQLLGMGLSFEEINEGLLDYMTLQRAGSRVSNQTAQQQAEASAKYTENLITLSKITGEDIKTQREKIAAASADVAFQMKLSKMSAEERRKVEMGLAEALAAGGETGALFFKQQILGMAPLTRETKLFAATMPGAASAVQSMADQARDSTVTMEQYQAGQIDRLADFVEGAAAAGEDLEVLLAASASGMEGPGKELAAILQGMGKQFTDYMTADGKFNKEKLKEDLEAAKTETGQRDQLVKGLTDFQSTLRNIKEAIELNIIGPLGKALGPQLTKIADLFKTSNDTILGPAIKKIGDALNSFISDVEEFGFQETFKKLFEQAKVKIGGWIGDGIKSIFKSMLPSLDTALIGLAAGIATLVFAPIAGPFIAIGAALAAMFGWETIKGWVSAGWDALKDLGKKIGELFSWGKIKSFFTDAWDSIMAIPRSIMNIFSGDGTLKDLLSSAINAVYFIPNKILELFNLGSVTDLFSSAWNTITGIPAKILEFFNLSSVSNFFSDAWDTITGIPAKILEFFNIDSVGAMFSSAWETITGIPSKILDFFNLDNLKLPSLSDLFESIVEKVRGFFTFDFKMPNFKDFLPTWLGGKGKKFGGDTEVASTPSAPDPQQVEATKPITIPENLNSIPGLDFATMNASLEKMHGTLESIGAMSSLTDRLDKIKTSLDVKSVTDYNKAIKNLTDTLEDLNKALAVDNKGLFGKGTGVAAADVIKAGGLGGGRSEDELQKLDQLNTTMVQILGTLQQGNEYGRRTVKAVRAGSNLQMGI